MIEQVVENKKERKKEKVCGHPFIWWYEGGTQVSGNTKPYRPNGQIFAFAHTFEYWQTRLPAGKCILFNVAASTERKSHCHFDVWLGFLCGIEKRRWKHSFARKNVSRLNRCKNTTQWSDQCPLLMFVSLNEWSIMSYWIFKCDRKPLLYPFFIHFFSLLLQSENNVLTEIVNWNAYVPCPGPVCVCLCASTTTTRWQKVCRFYHYWWR